MKSQGFSLIELMIVVAIVCILSAIALPSYQNYAKRARFLEVMSAAQPFKLAIAIALQQGQSVGELKNNIHGIPSEPSPTRNLASIRVENGSIYAMGTELVNSATYILKPNADGSHWSVSGSCLKMGLCEE